MARVGRLEERPGQLSCPPEASVESTTAAPPRTGLGLFAAVVAFLLPIAYSPTVNAPFWSVRVAVVLLVVAVGLPRLGTLLRSGDGAARCAAAFLAVAIIAALVARHPAASVFGPYGFGAGLLMVAAVVAAWAIGRSLDAVGRRDVATGILAGVLVNVVVALAQEAFDLRSADLSPFRGAYGLLGNPVHLGALLAGGTGLLAASFRGQPRRWALPAMAVGAALQLSGSRTGMLALSAVALASIWRWPRLLIATFSACLVAGFGGALLAGPLLPDHASSPTVVQKLEVASEGELYDRLENWRAGASAMSDRPLFGYGPGRLVEATSPRRTAKMATDDPETVFYDAHNLFAEYLVTTGPLGLLALVGLLVLARPTRGPLLWCALGILALHLMQPQSFGTTPIAFLALGAAAPPTRAGRGGRVALASTGVFAVVAVVGAGRLLVGDFLLDQANLDFSTAQGRRAAAYLSPWPESASKLGEIYFFRSATENVSVPKRQELEGRSVHWLAEAVRRDPARATSWNNLADVELALGRPHEARRAFAAALERNPWSTRALAALAAIALDDGDDSTADAFVTRAERVASPEAVQQLVQQRRRRT